MVEAAPGDPGLQAGPLLTTPATLPLQHHPVVIGRAAEHAEVAVLCDQRRKVFGEHLVRYRRGDLGAHHAVVGHLVDAVAAGQAHDRHGPLIASGRHGSSWRYQAIAVSIASTWASGSRPRGAAIWSRNAGGRRDQHHLHAKCAGGTWRRHPPGQAWVACTPVTIRPPLLSLPGGGDELPDPVRQIAVMIHASQGAGMVHNDRGMEHDPLERGPLLGAQAHPGQDPGPRRRVLLRLIKLVRRERDRPGGVPAPRPAARVVLLRAAASRASTHSGRVALPHWVLGIGLPSAAAGRSQRGPDVHSPRREPGPEHI
jgi:hypothetical protein